MSAGFLQFRDRMAGDEDRPAAGGEFDQAGEELAARE